MSSNHRFFKVRLGQVRLSQVTPSLDQSSDKLMNRIDFHYRQLGTLYRGSIKYLQITFF